MLECRCLSNLGLSTLFSLFPLQDSAVSLDVAWSLTAIADPGILVLPARVSNFRLLLVRIGDSGRL
jgi:hypothetical protein